jgi:excisionase family DNA binding protein
MAILEKPTELLNTSAAAKYLGLEPQTLSTWRCLGRYGLPFIRVGRCIKYRRSDLDKWLESRSETGGAVPA